MNKINLLLIDDDKIFLLSAKSYLSILEDKINIITIDNPQEALEYIKNNKIDIIFVDYFMPQMTGEIFISKLREFNTSALVVLQTGYADKKPPVEMLESMDIQGYFDKTSSPEELEISVRSAIKTHDLIQIIKEKETEIDMLNYKNNFMGDLIVGITDSLKGQVITIKESQDQINKIVEKKHIKDIESNLNLIKNCIEKELKTINAMDFYTNQKYELKEILDIVNTLLKVKLLMNKTNLNINIEKEFIVNCKSSILVIILVEIISYLCENKIENIDLNILQDNNVIIEIITKFDYEENFLRKINSIKKEDENIDIIYDKEEQIIKLYITKM